MARPPGYRLELSGGTDLNLAERLIGQARVTPAPTERVRHLEAALALWRGRPLADVSGLSWLDSQAERLAQLRLDTLYDLHEVRLALGEHAQLIAELENLTREHPYQERLHRHLMLAFYRAGRQADALSAYQRLRRRLADELGTEPGPGLRDLESAILRQAATLDPPAATQPPAATEAPPAGRTDPRQRRDLRARGRRPRSRRTRRGARCPGSYRPIWPDSSGGPTTSPSSTASSTPAARA